MTAQFFPKLSQNYVEILDDDEEYYDITIEVGKDPNVKIFRAHMIILCYRSPFFRRTLASDKKEKDGVLTHIKLPNILPEIFQLILKYIYGGTISLEHETTDLFKVLVAANQLHLQELVDYLQKYLIENKSEWIEQHFEFTCQTSFQSNSLFELQQFCTDLMTKTPEKVFKSFDFTSLPEKSLISLLKRNDLQIKEVEIWEYVLKWGLKRNPTLDPDPITWSEKDIEIMENTLQNCLPLIRFFVLSSEEFVKKVRPYKKLLNHQLYEDLLYSYLDPNSKPSDNILLPRNRNIDGIIDTKIVNLNIISIVSKWIDDKVEIKDKFEYVRELYLPYKLKLLLRGSKDGFSPHTFHRLCDNIVRTVTFIKVKDTEEILGGYNPLIWESPFLGKCGQTKDSFIFSFKNMDDFKVSILSRVLDEEFAVFYRYDFGPTFNHDLFIKNHGEDGKGIYNKNFCKKEVYEQAIRDTKENFSIEEYEVFQILTIPSLSEYQN